jgi:2-methylcitrate dehydratase
MVAIPLLYGRLTASDYEDDIADDPMIDVLRKKMEVRENTNFTNDYFDKNKRYIGNAVQVFFKDKTFTKKAQVDVPIGHRKRRAEGAPLLKSKFQISIEKRLKDKQIDQLLLLYDNPKEFLKMAFDDFIALLVV